MTLPFDQNRLHHARTLRKEMTPEERHLWYDFLRDYPVKIYKQRIIGPYIADFFCDAAKLVIEIDGSQHFEEPGQQRDAIRTQYLESLGLLVFRCSNRDIHQAFESTCEAIDHLIRHRCPKKFPPKF